MAKFGAVAYSKSTGSIGYTSQIDDPEEAKRQALSFCGEGDAVVLACESDCWLAIALSDSTGGYWCASGTDGPTAVANAFEKLHEEVGATDIRLFICFSTNDGEEYRPEPISPMNNVSAVVPKAGCWETSKRLFIAIPCIGIGLLCLAAGGWLGWSSWSAISAGVRIEGRVVEMAEVKSTKPAGGIRRNATAGVSYAPVVEYQVNQKTYRIRGQVSSSFPSHSVGDSIVVRYPPGNPSEGRIDSFMENWLAPIIFTVGGLIFTVIGFVVLSVKPRPARVSHPGADLPSEGGGA